MADREEKRASEQPARSATNGARQEASLPAVLSGVGNRAFARHVGEASDVREDPWLPDALAGAGNGAFGRFVGEASNARTGHSTAPAVAPNGTRGRSRVAHEAGVACPDGPAMRSLADAVVRRRTLARGGPPATPAAPAAPAAEIMPSPRTVEWSTDRFEVSFSHTQEDTDRFVFTVRYLGAHKTQGPFVKDGAKSLSVMIGPKTLQPKVVRADATGVAVDLYSDGSKVVELLDKASLDKRPDSFGREHDLSVMDAQRVQHASSIWVLDPKASETEITAAAPQEFAGDRPSMQLTIDAEDLVYSVLIDGDGDEDKELLLRFTATENWPDDTYRDLVKTLKVQATQRSTGAVREAHFDVPRDPVRGSLFPIVQEVTDGHAPTRIDLQIPSGKRILEIGLGTRGPADTRYRISLGTHVVDYIFPVDPKPPRRVAAAAPPVIAGGVMSWDVTLGAYGDRFRVAVRQMAAGKTTFGLSALRGDEPNGTGGLELALDGPIRGGVVDTGPTSIAFDVDGDGKPDLQLFDQLTTPAEVDGGGPPARARNHRVRVLGKAVTGERTFDFTYRNGVLLGGFAKPGEVDIEAGRNAEAVTVLSEQGKAGGLGNELDALELRMLPIRMRAVERKIVGDVTVKALAALWRQLVVTRPQAPKVEPGRKRLVHDAAQEFDAAYSKEFTDLPFTKVVALGQMKGAIDADDWTRVFAHYRLVAEHFDSLMVQRMTEREGTGTKDVKEAGALVDLSKELGEIPGKAIRVAASYHPDEKFQTEQGYVSAMPLNLWAWKDGGTWRLKDATNPAKPYTYSVDDDGASPPLALLGKLNDPDHFPVGIVNFNVPGGLAGRVPVEDRMTWKKFFTYLGLGLAAIGAGLSLATPGGPVAVAGAWALTAAALSGAIAAGIDLVEHIQHDNLDAQTAALDIAQIVAGIAGASALASGRIVVSASRAPAGARWAGSWAKAAELAQHVILPATAVAAAGDIVTFAVIAVDTAKQLDEIENGTRDAGTKSRAKLLLLSQVAIMGGLTALSVKGTIAGLGKGPKLVLTPGPDGVPVATAAIGEHSLIVDTNVASILDMKARGEKLQPGQEAMLKKLGLLDTSDLRVTDRTITERLAQGAKVPQHGVPISVERTSLEYQVVLDKLKEFNVGDKGGTSDREIVADALFAITEDGVRPTFATHDKDVYNKLYSLKAAAEGLPKIEKLPKSIPDMYPDGFPVTVTERTIHVLPLPKK